MSSESERSESSLENESVKRSPLNYDEEDKIQKNTEDSQIRYHPSMSPSPHPMMYRHSMEPHMMRPHMQRPISPHVQQTEDSDLTDAMIFLNRIKEEYNDNLQVYDSFLETMRDFRFEKIDAEEVCKAVRILFKDKQYLIRLFDEYLPHHLRNGDANRNFDLQMSERQNNMPYRGPSFISKPPTPIHMGQMPPNSAIHINRMPPQIAHSAYMRPHMRHSPPPMSIPHDSAQRFKHMSTQSPRHRTAEEFVQQVKKRYINKPLVYKQFVELLQNSKNSFDKLYTQVSALLNDSPDLIEKFERNFRTTQIPSGPVYNPDADPLRKIKQKLASQGTLDQFLKIINFYNQNYLSAEDLVSLVEPLIEDKENIDAFKMFIKFKDPFKSEELDKIKDVEKIGSYKFLPVQITINPSLALSKEVLNSICVCVPTHESEEDTYIFRHKNHSEELLCRISDERSEADLMIDRLKYLIIRLEEIYETIGDGELDLGDIQMSSQLLKETLSRVYENRSSEILESILTNPKKAIPVILKRLNKVLKENIEKIRDLKKFWRNIVDEHYYKAYDTKGVLHRSQEKNYLSLRHISADSATPKEFTITDTSLFTLIRDLFDIFIRNHTSNGFRKQSIESLVRTLESTIENLSKDAFSSVVNFDKYALYYYILILYTRFNEIKNLSFSPIDSNPMAVSIHLQEEMHIENRYEEITRAAIDLMKKEIDVDRFEDIVRRMTDCAGYKLYNLKKIVSKIEKQINIILDDDLEQSAGEDEENSSYSIIKNGSNVTIRLNEENEN